MAVSNLEYQVGNNVQVQLTSQALSGDTTLDIDDASVLPDTNHLLTLYDNTNEEIIEVTSVDTTNNTITVNRGQENTTAVDWPSGTQLENRLTAGTMQTLASTNWVDTNYNNGIASIDGVTNDGGDIDLVSDGNVNITPDNTNNNIGIESFIQAEEDGGSSASYSDISKLNFSTGLNTSESSETLTIDVDSVTIKRAHLKKTTGEAVDQGTSNAIDIGWGSEYFIDTDVFTHSGSTVTVESDGIYRITASVTYENATNSARNTPVTYVKINGSVQTSTKTADYDRGEGYGKYSHNTVHTVLSLSSGDNITIGTYAHNEDGTLSITPDWSELIIEKVGTEASGNTWRDIESTPTSGNTGISISSDWADGHTGTTNPHSTSLDSLSDSNIDTSNLASGQELVYNGSNWVNGQAQFADLVFQEKRCEVCGDKFKEGESVSLIVNKVKEDGTYLVPKHEGC